MPLVDLPTELLDHVFSYLDWDPTRTLSPRRDDLLNASLTCRHLRKVLEPAIFKYVTLRLCWAEGQLVEPRWYRLRKERPELAKHVRCVYINTGSEQCFHCLQKNSTKALVAPQEYQDWLNLSLSNDPQYSSRDALWLRPRVDEYARQHYQQGAGSKVRGFEQAFGAEDLIRMTKIKRRSNAELDKLSVFMLCIPPSVNKIIFKAHMDRAHNRDKNTYAYRLLSIALDLLHDKIRDLIIISNQSERIPRFIPTATPPDTVDYEPIPNGIMQKLTTERLTLAINDETTFDGNGCRFRNRGFQKWHQLSSTVREIDIRYATGNHDEFLEFFRGFEKLDTIRFKDCIVTPHSHGTSAQMDALDQHLWLTFLVDLRRICPYAKIELSCLYRSRSRDPLPNGAIQWLQNQAVPKGAVIGLERLDRLVEDFVSFMPMWFAEDGPRGRQAMKDWGTQRATLSDEAMTRRWQ